MHALIVYTVVEGANAEWVKGSGEDLLIVVKRSKDDSTTFDHFVRIEVDGRVLDAENYDAVSGSVRATLKNAYLETLSEGEHTVKLVFDDGEVSTTLSISPESTPVTGDNSMIVVYSMLMALSAIAFIALYFGRKQEDVQKAEYLTGINGDGYPSPFSLCIIKARKLRALWFYLNSFVQSKFRLF